jgi:hypothetical protein
LHNAFADIWDGRGRVASKRQRPDPLRPRHQAVNPDSGLVRAGEGIDLITAVESARNLVTQITALAERSLREISRLAP